MLPTIELDPALIIAHVLFVDIVSYSKLPLDEQTRVLRDLRRAVKGSPTFQVACAQQSIVSLPSGDGVALAFFSSPECPVKCALEVSKGIRESSDVKLRMGVHSGPVYHVQDIRGENIVAGSGINMAQRVMDCGDAGHILLSSTIAEVLKETTGWAKHICDLGEVEVKHGVRLRISNLCVGEDGNAAIPNKLRRSTADSPRASSQVPASTAPGSGFTTSFYPGPEFSARPEPIVPQDKSLGGHLRPATITHATQCLARYVGPISSVLVRKAAKRADSVRDLYLLLADELENETEREQFLREAGV